MRALPAVLRAVAALVLFLWLSGLPRANAQAAGLKPESDIIVTAAPAYEPLAALRGAERFAQGAQLLLIHAGKAEPLLPSFAASADANISFDGKSLLFAGKEKPGSPWQIWELRLADRSLRRIVASTTDAIRPQYLPAGRLVFALHTPQGFQITSAGKDALRAAEPIDDSAGSNLLPLSYVQADAVPVDVLHDGRILFEAGYPLGSGKTPELYLAYSDGSGVESYRCDHGAYRWGGRQLANGDVVFTHGGSLARFTSPLAHEAPIAAPHAQYAGSVAETASGAWLVSARAAAGTRYVLKQWKPGSAALQSVFAANGKDVVDPVVIAPRTRPNRHPSGLHDWSYANLLALDARLSRLGELKTAPAAVRLETLDAEGHAVANGTAPVEHDGSFFVQVPGDRPIRFALLDAKGAVLRQEQGWFWIRRGEQRICVGCHTGPERASENRVPAILLRTTTPFDLTGAKPAVTGQTAAGGNSK